MGIRRRRVELLRLLRDSDSQVSTIPDLLDETSPWLGLRLTFSSTLPDTTHPSYSRLAIFLEPSPL